MTFQRVLLLTLMPLFLVACTSTKMVGTWADEEYLSATYDQVAAIGMVDRLDVRRAWNEKQSRNCASAATK
jgi:hypothetical protein